MNTNPTIAISGATGFIGSQLCAHFVQQGYRVIGFCRSTPVNAINNVEYRIFNLEYNPDATLFKDATVFIHCAYLKGEEAKATNIEGTKRVLQASRNAGVKKNIFFSSMSAHADALSAYGQQKFQLEKEFYGINDAIIRPGLVIGKGGLFLEMVKHIQTKGIVPLIDGGNQPLYTVHSSDVLNATETIITKNLNGVFTVAEPSAVAYKDFYKELASVLNKKVWMLAISYTLIESLLSLTKFLGIKTGVGKENLLGLKALKTFEFSDDLKRIGFTPINFKESLRMFLQS
ncbi:MAG: NAD-dependent epimerase/dehydratase family protein [Bacteroidia bacterium]